MARMTRKQRKKIPAGYIGHADPQPVSYWLRLRECWRWLDSGKSQTASITRPRKEWTAFSAREAA